MSKEIEDKAKAICDKFHYQICNDCGLSESDSTSFAAKMCSFIHVEGIIEAFAPYKGMHDQEFFDADVQYYKEVLSAIKNL